MSAISLHPCVDNGTRLVRAVLCRLRRWNGFAVGLAPSGCLAPALMDAPAIEAVKHEGTTTTPDSVRTLQQCEVMMSEPVQANTTQPPSSTAYGMLAHEDRAAAGAAANLYRFGASRAYYEIVEERLSALSEDAVPGYYTWRDFLHRRIAPAMRTCRSVKERQAKLSDKLTRSIALLRSWIDAELERQDRDLLASMNNRARLQLRLQQTVEGLSVGAISYYVVSLLGDLLKGMPAIHDIVALELAIAALVPVVILMIW